jgi:hypothetical protein
MSKPAAPVFARFWIMQDATTGRVFSTASLDGKGMELRGIATRAPDALLVELLSPNGTRREALRARDAERAIEHGCRLP